jgi:hypothetical protein
MASTYNAIATTTLGSAQSNITFSSFSGYTDLILIFNGKVSANDDLYLQFNSDTGTNYSNTTLRGNGTTASSTRGSSTTGARLSDQGSPTTGTESTVIAHLQNYSNTTTYKTIIDRANNASTGADAIASLWRSTSAITTIKLYCGGGANLAVGSIATLYGIKAA